jgi:RNA polymerase sigma-70 factor (ECF subfamily)
MRKDEDKRWGMEPEEFGRFMMNHQRIVYGIALNYTHDHHAAEDVCQETFMKAYTSLGTLRDRSKIKSWLCSIARTTALNWVRERRRNPVLSLEHTGLDLAKPEKRTDERVKDVLEVLDTLREDYREIFLMKYLEEMSYKEIADTLGTTVSSVGEKLYRVRSMVIERIKRREKL